MQRILRNRRHDSLRAFALALTIAGLAGTPASVRAAEPAAPAPVAAATCDLSAAKADVAAARATLLAEPEPEEMVTDVAPGTKQALARYKEAIGALIAARFECASPRQSADALAASLGSAAAPDACDGDCRERAYAGAPDFAATRIDDTRHLLAVTATVPIPCGSDSMLFVYRREGTHWREAVRWISVPYDQVSGAHGAFDYRIAPPDAHGNWYVLVKDIPPWCTSAWASVRYAALRPSSDPAQPQVLHRGSDSIWWGGDDEGALSAAADAFELRFHSSSYDLGVHNRVWVRHFALDGDAVHRIPPLALTARDFVDEWIVSKWDAVAPWSSDDAAAALKQWHERVRGGEDFPHGQFKAAHACNAREDAVEVEIARGDGDGESYFLRVEGTPQDFRMVRVDTASDPDCDGEDLLPELGAP